MKKVYEYSHLGGAEILQVRFPKINREIDAIIASVKVTKKTKVSKKKAKMGVKLFAPVEIIRNFCNNFGPAATEKLETVTISRFRIGNIPFAEHLSR